MAPLHSWDLTPKQAVQLQKDLAPRVPTGGSIETIRRIAAVDAAYLPRQRSTVAACVLLSWPGLEILEQRWHVELTRFPYLPGLLSFREIPAVLQAFQQLSSPPDLIFVDGHGRAHPRRFGIATHLGFWLGIPTIGIGKSKLCGDYHQPGIEKGQAQPLWNRDERIGVVLRSRRGVKPIFVSIGSGISLECCLHWTQATLTRFRLPEPIRAADRFSHEAKRLWLLQGAEAPSQAAPQIEEAPSR